MTVLENRVEMRSLGYPTVPYNWYAYKKEASERRERQAQREDDVKTQRKDSCVTGMMHLEANECQARGKYQKREESRKNSPLWHLHLRPLDSKTVRQ